MRPSGRRKNAGDDQGVVMVERVGVQAPCTWACADRRGLAVPGSSRSSPAGFLSFLVRILFLREQGRRMVPTPPGGLRLLMLRARCGVLAQLLCGKNRLFEGRPMVALFLPLARFLLFCTPSGGSSFRIGDDIDPL